MDAIHLRVQGGEMAGYPIDKKLVIGIASSALFDLSESDDVFTTKGEDEYRKYQREHQDDTLQPGVAFAFIKRLLSLNSDKSQPVEVVLLSRNDPDTGLRVRKSIEHYGLDITRAVYVAGRTPYRYIPAFNVCLFLSANEKDVKEAIMANYPAGQVVGDCHTDDPDDKELRIAFDFDGVLADDEAERVYRDGGLVQFHSSERAKAATPHSPGPLFQLVIRIAELQKLERAKALEEPGYEPKIRIAIITARNAPADERMITTLRHFGITVDETFLLGGIPKENILKIFKPHIFFDDQRIHLDASCGIVPCVHIPFGIRNAESEKTAT